MPKPPYTGPETQTSLGVVKELLPGLPHPPMIIGGWAVFFLVQDVWKRSFQEEYFGSRDIDLGFHTPPGAKLADLQGGNLPATAKYLEAQDFRRENMYQFVRYHEWDTNRVLSADEVGRLPSHAYYGIAVDLIVSHQREDLREIAGFQGFAEPLLEYAFVDALHRNTIRIGGHNVWIPAPHLMLAMKATSLPDRQKDDKSIKDICDAYAVIAASGVAPATLRNRLHRVLLDAPSKIRKVVDSPFVEAAANFLEVTPSTLTSALKQML